MPVMTNPFLNNSVNLGAGGTLVANVLDGAQYGFGNSLPNIDAATPLIMRPIVPIITHIPTMFQYIPGADAVLKALIERHTTKIEGIEVTPTLEADQVPSGQDGQELNMPKNARRAAVQPNMTMPELTGNLVWNFFRQWMRMIKDPDTQASSLAGLLASGAQLSPQVMSAFCMDMLFIQYDNTLQPENIIDAFFITSMWPFDIGGGGYSKTLGQSERPDRNVQFYGVLQHNANTKAVGQQIAQVLNLHLVNYDLATPITQTIESAIQDYGIEGEVAADYKNFVLV